MRKEELEKLRQEYPTGTVLELTEDMQSDGKPEQGLVKNLQGKLSYIDDAGQLHMHWNNGRSLALIPGIDSFIKVQDKRVKKPICKLIGEDGNVFNLAGIVSRTLKDNDLPDEAKEVWDKLKECKSYDQALQLFMQYVDIE
jgi:hypothetical protein